MQSVMNLKIKHRESFRPFAPAVLAEDVDRYFALDRGSPYMLIVAPVREGLRLTMTDEQSRLFGIEKLNLTVQGLSSQFAQLQAVQGVSLVGHDVVVPGNTLQVAEDATAQAGYELANPADQVKVEILAPSGKVIDTLNLGAQTSGVHSFDWQAGANASATGLRFRVTATSGSVNMAATTLVRDKVAAVSTANSVFSLELENAGTVPYSSIKAFN